MKLRHPAARLANCCWLPRLADKTRIHLAGELPLSYRIAFGSAIGVDGYFLRHFRLRLPAVIGAVKSSPDDEALARWFTSRPGVAPALIEEWNAFAPKLGSKGHPGYAARQTLKWLLYPRSIFHPVNSLFEAIVQDEDLAAPGN